MSVEIDGIDLLVSRYIRYEGDLRIEHPLFPRNQIRNLIGDAVNDVPEVLGASLIPFPAEKSLIHEVEEPKLNGKLSPACGISTHNQGLCPVR